MQRNQRSNCQHALDHTKIKWISEKTSTSASLTTVKSLTVDHNKLWKILKEMGIPNHLPCLLRGLYAGQETTVRTGHGKTNWFQIGKGVCQGCVLSPCLFNLYAEYIMWNTQGDEAQAGMKTAKRNNNKFKYVDETTLKAESEEELKAFWRRWKAVLKLNNQKANIMASGPIHFMANRWGNNGNSDRHHFLGLQNQCGKWLQPWN